MLRTSRILLTTLVAAQSALAQAGEKPSMNIPEPQRERSSARFFTITIVDYELADKNRDRFPTAIPDLIQFFKTSTTIEADLRWNKFFLSSPRLTQASMLYMTGNDAVLQLTDVEKKNLGTYLKSGGLLFAEEIRYSDPENGLMGKEAGVAGTPFDRQFKALMKDPLVLSSQGKQWQKIPKTHPLYSSYWDFPEGPPMGGTPGGNVFALEMLELRGRVAVIFSDLNISWYWGDPLADTRRRGQQFGVNLIVYAMTQRRLGGPLPGTRP